MPFQGRSKNGYEKSDIIIAIKKIYNVYWIYK